MCEGTRFTQEKHAASVEIAKQKGLPILKHHLLPRTKGFTLVASQIKGRANREEERERERAVRWEGKEWCVVGGSEWVEAVVGWAYVESEAEVFKWGEVVYSG